MDPIGRARAAILVLALAGSAIGPLARTGAAQGDAPVPAWRVECDGDGKSLNCRAVQQVFAREPRQPLVSVAVRPSADGKRADMVVQLPLGLNLAEPVAIRVDDGPTERQSIQTCTSMGCFAAITLDDERVAAMRAGGQLKITVQDVTKRTLEVSLPLLGFGLAFDKAK